MGGTLPTPKFLQGPQPHLGLLLWALLGTWNKSWWATLTTRCGCRNPLSPPALRGTNLGKQAQ